MPDLCILDVSMPAGDLGVDDRSTGFEVCRRIKRDPRTARIPVIFVTALNDTTDRVKAIEAGGDDFLTKPHNRLVLGARVRSLLKLKAATDALEESLRKQKELEKVRDDLMKMIVHDLKSPLTSIIGAMEMLIDGDFGALTVEQRGALGDAESARRGSARAHRGPARGGAARGDAARAASRAHRARRAARRGAARVGDPLPAGGRDRGDRSRRRRAGDRGGPRAAQARVRQPDPERAHALGARRHGHARRAAENDGTLFTVADDGVGIPAEYHDIIFRKFEQVKTPHIPRVRSSGLGLAFCKLVVEAHGGRIWVKSGGDMVGSAFHFWLPVKPPAASAPIA